MMSPDPPREEPQDDSFGRLGPEGFNTTAVLVMDEDMIGEGEYELDFSSDHGSESDTSDDDEHYRGNGTELLGRMSNDNEDEEAESNEDGHQVRGRYQMLIPFQIETVETTDTIDIELEAADASANSHDGDPTAVDPHYYESPAPEVNQGTSRQIELSEDNVETIKNVMRGFKLPDSSIPGWAKDLNEDSWKTKLVDSIEVKSITSSRTKENP